MRNFAITAIIWILAFAYLSFTSDSEIVKSIFCASGGLIIMLYFCTDAIIKAMEVPE